jgi:hypothetical protein
MSAAGLGVSWLRLNAASDALNVKFERDEVLAYQVMAGVTYNVGRNWGVFTELRRFGTENGRWRSGDGLRARRRGRGGLSTSCLPTRRGASSCATKQSRKPETDQDQRRPASGHGPA